MLFLRPVEPRFPITQRYGENPDLYPLTKGHNGIDYGCPIETPIRAAANGEVIRTDLDAATAIDPKSGYGYHIRIQHPNGYITIYAHLDKMGIAVSTGQIVQAGQFIGLSGNTGRSTGPHLHFEVRSNSSIGSSFDPSGMIVDKMPSMTPLFVSVLTKEGNTLAVRAGPSKKYTVLRRLVTGDRSMIYAIQGTDIWMLTDDGWMKYEPIWHNLFSLEKE